MKKHIKQIGYTVKKKKSMKKIKVGKEDKEYGKGIFKIRCSAKASLKK